MRRNVFALCAAAMLLAAAPLAAQENRPWLQPTFITIDVPFQPLDNNFSESVSVADTLRRTENVAFVADYESTRGALVDLGGGIRVAKNFGVGVTASWFRRSGSGSFDLKVPNPLVANRPLDRTTPRRTNRSRSCSRARARCRESDPEGQPNSRAA